MTQLRGHYCGVTSTSNIIFDNFYSTRNGVMSYPGDINGVSSVSTETVEGWSTCIFKRTVSVADGAENFLYDLTQSNLDSVIAVGRLNGERLNYHGFRNYDHFSSVDYKNNIDYKINL